MPNCCERGLRGQKTQARGVALRIVDRRSTPSNPMARDALASEKPHPAFSRAQYHRTGVKPYL